MKRVASCRDAKSNEGSTTYIIIIMKPKHPANSASASVAFSTPDVPNIGRPSTRRRSGGIQHENLGC